MLDELATAAGQHGAEHALAFAQAGILALFVLDVDVEGIALEEQLQKRPTACFSGGGGMMTPGLLLWSCVYSQRKSR
jgi:hypothetical protein